MIETLFHAWERRLVSVTNDRLVRPFEWGLDWIEANGHAPGTPPQAILLEWAAQAVASSQQFFETPDTSSYTFEPEAGGATGALTFPSALRTPHPENNTVHLRYFRGTRAGKGRRAVVVLPQWNADADGHVGLCRLLNRFGLSALRLSLPYHDARRPPELNRADYIVSSNIGRTVQVCRQAVMDARRAVAWLSKQGYERIGILGTSLGSCLSLLTTAHEPLVRVQALNHISPYFADVIWRGISTVHVRAGLEGHIDLDQLRQIWLPISPQAYLDRIEDKKSLLVYAKYDLTFPVDLSRDLVTEFQRRGIPHELAVLPCGHYSTGAAPFKYLDGFLLARFLDRNL
ncbi:MAG: abhydrolase domain-containing 18 [Acidobacteria bacterium]|nr:abhydrolase domain-containing 18 [Acidobacteriota bacterium]